MAKKVKRRAKLKQGTKADMCRAAMAALTDEQLALRGAAFEKLPPMVPVYKAMHGTSIAKYKRDEVLKRRGASNGTASSDEIMSTDRLLEARRFADRVGGIRQLEGYVKTLLKIIEG